MNRQWLLDNADAPIKYILTRENGYADKLFENQEIQYWFSRLKQRSDERNLGDIHGSHDYRMENILGKCWILGMSKDIFKFDNCIRFILDFLDKHIHQPNHGSLSFGKLYSYRDYETVLSCFLPLLGYNDIPSIKYIAEKRINILYDFTKYKRYNIYVDGSKYKGVKKEWQPYLINPELYSDGNIALPTMHDFILFAGIYKGMNTELKDKIETIVEWIFDERYMSISRRYGYFYATGGSYNVKAIIFKMHLINFKDMLFNNSDFNSLLFTCYVLSHFDSAKKSEWFGSARLYLDNYKTPNNRYKFPSHMIAEKLDNYVINGGHMNVGENKRSKQYAEIISTYWMNKIFPDLY